MNLRKHTSIIIIIATVALAGYDILPLLTKVDGDTISEVLRDWAPRHPFVPLALCVLIGHWFIHIPGWTRPKHGPKALALLGLLVLAGSLIASSVGVSIWIPAVVTGPIGLALGATLWSLEAPRQDKEVSS